MTDNIINFQDIKTNLEETRRILSSFAFEEVTALNIEQLSNNLIIISNTLEKTIGLAWDKNKISKRYDIWNSCVSI